MPLNDEIQKEIFNGSSNIKIKFISFKISNDTVVYYFFVLLDNNSMSVTRVQMEFQAWAQKRQKIDIQDDCVVTVNNTNVYSLKYPLCLVGDNQCTPANSSKNPTIVMGIVLGVIIIILVLALIITILFFKKRLKRYDLFS